MTVTEENGRLEFLFDAGDGKVRRESVTGVKPTVADQDIYDVATGIADLINDTLQSVRLTSRKNYSA